MFREFFRFEARYQLRSPLVWVIAFVFAFMTFVAMTSDVVQIGGAIGNVHRNAPYVILRFLSTLSILGMLVAIALIAQPLLRDFELGTDELLFSTPMRRGAYLWGRIAAGLITAVGVYLVVVLAMIIGSFMPWLDPERVGPLVLQHYAWVCGVLVVPNLIFVAAVMSLLAVTTRRLLYVFLGAIAFLVLWQIAGALTRDIQNDTIASLIDPFGARTVARVMRYWSVTERNTQLPDLSGLLLLNRVIWLGIAAVMFAAAHLLFNPQRQRARKSRRRRAEAEVPAGPVTHVAAAPMPARVFDRSTALSQLVHLLVFDTKAVLKSIPFLVLIAFGLLNFVGGLDTLETSFGTSVYPVTALLLESMQGSYQFLLAIVLVYYAGDIVWKERDARFSEVNDALPVPNWVPMLAKFGAMCAVVLVFMLVGALAAIVYQLFKGYTNLEPALYVRALLVDSAPFAIFAGLALFIQVISNQKFLGYVLLIVAIILPEVLRGMGFEHNLYIFGGAPQMTYSDMNGYGHLLTSWGWLQTYWALFVAMLVVLASAFWVRGTASQWSHRRREAALALRGPQGVLLAAFAIAFVGVGGWIFYNADVMNEYLPREALFDRQARVEKEYRKFRGLPQPRITDVKADVDIFPEQRRIAVRGHYRLVNKHDAPIQDLHVYINPTMQLRVVAPTDATVKLDDPQAGFRIYTLRTPLAAGEALDFDFTVERTDRGFTNNGMPPSRGGGDLRSPLNENGTFFNSNDLMPHFGYVDELQIIDRNERRKRDLGDVPRMAKLEDESARGSMSFPDADWINFETTVSTSEDQIALAPGYLQREWTENGRRYFHYKMDQPMLPYYCYLSARWQVKRGDWHGMPIEVYYDAKHPYNVDRMIDATRKSLDYFTANFSPYQHKQVRILEFPRYARFAQSFANTIPYSESIGFVADLRDPEEIDFVFYVTAHEMAHQWWAHQVIGADVQGSTMIVESMAQYSALMVMEKEYGRERMRRFLKYELDRYLSGRGGELVEELPLMRVENQPYIHYSKGSLIFYRLREEIGEENLNRALANYIRDKAFQKPPYTTTVEMLDYIRAETPADKAGVIEDLFAKIVLYDNRVTAARSTRRDDGKYDVEIDYETVKRQSDGMGREVTLPLDDWMEVGAFAREPGQKEREEKLLYLQPQHITQASGTIKLTLDAEPYEIGLDPYNKLIDRIPDDNRLQVE